MRRLICFLFLCLLASPVLASDEAHVFVYHRFGDSRHPSTNISLNAFEDQLKYLRQEEFSVLSLGEALRRVGSGEGLPLKCAVLTVDDAYRSFLTGGMPLLRRYGYPATLFVATDAVGKEGYLSWDELRGIAAQGIEIGNHSASHAHLVRRLPGEEPSQWRQRVAADIRRAQEVLARELEVSAALFAYPFGEYTPELQEVVAELGFRGAAAQHSGVLSSFVDLWAVPRFPMGGVYGTLDEFREKSRMRALPVTVVAPVGTIVERNPPVLEVRIEGAGINLDQLNCYVPGQEQARIRRKGKGRFLIEAEAPLEPGRSKYTLTAPAKEGGRWYWFSHLWIAPGEDRD